MPTNKKKKILKPSRAEILNDFNTLFLNDEKEEQQAQKLFAQEFRNIYKKEQRDNKRKILKKKKESRKINLKTKRKLKKSKIKDSIFHDQNGLSFQSKQQDLFLSSPIVITQDFLENDFLTFLFNNFSDDIIRFVNQFKKKKNKYAFTIGYHFYFEGLGGDKTFAFGFRPKVEMFYELSDLIVTLQDLFNQIIKRFEKYYIRANNYVLKFKGLTLEASPL